MQTEKKNDRPTFQLCCAVITISLCGSFHFGYQQSTINGAQAVIRKFFNESSFDNHGIYFCAEVDTWTWAFFTGSFHLFAVVGTEICRRMVDAIGRRKTLIFNGFFTILSACCGAIAFFTNIYELMFVVRILLGVVTGIGLTVQPMMLTEICPVNLRGSTNVFMNSMTRGSYLLGAIMASANIFGSENSWFWFYIIEICVSIAYLCGILYFVHESPSYLILHGREEETRNHLREYQGSNANLDRIITNIKNEIAMQNKRLTIYKVMKSEHLRKPALIGIMISLTSAFTGISIVATLSALMLTRTGFTTKQSADLAIGIAASGFIAVSCLVYFIEHFGRRTMLIVSLLIICLVDLSMMAFVLLFNAFEQLWMGYAFVGMQFIFFFAFSSGVGPIAWFISSEMMPIQGRAALQSTTNSTVFVIAGLLPLIFLPLESAIGAYSFLIFIVPTIILTTLSYFLVPETKNRTIEEILEDINGAKGDKIAIAELENGKLRKNNICDKMTTF